MICVLFSYKCKLEIFASYNLLMDTMTHKGGLTLKKFKNHCAIVC